MNTNIPNPVFFLLAPVALVAQLSFADEAENAYAEERVAFSCLLKALRKRCQKSCKENWDKEKKLKFLSV